MLGMDRQSRLAPALIVGLLLLLVVYVAGYFFRGYPPPLAAGETCQRTFSRRWMCAIYLPAAKVEAMAYRACVYLECEGESVYAWYDHRP